METDDRARHVCVSFTASPPPRSQRKVRSRAHGNGRRSETQGFDGNSAINIFNNICCCDPARPAGKGDVGLSKGGVVFRRGCTRNSQTLLTLRRSASQRG